MAEHKKVKAMVAGHICLDITPQFHSNQTGDFSELLSPGKLINVGDAALSIGGAVCNTGLALAKLGADIKLNGKLGNDHFGKIIMDLLGEGGAGSFKVVEGQSSSYSIVIAVPGVDRIFLHNPGTNDTFTADDIDMDALDGCDLFHFGYPTLMKQMFVNKGEQLSQMYRQVKDKDIITSMDISLPDPESKSGKVNWENILSDTLKYIDIFLPSIEEIAFMLDKDLFYRRKKQAGGDDPVLYYSAGDCDNLSGQLLDMGGKIIAIKNGIKGYYLRTADKKRLSPLAEKIDIDKWSSKKLWAPSYEAGNVVSATGAGDVTIAGFLTAVLKGLNPLECVKAANILGWQNLRAVDATGGIEDWRTTLKMIQQGNIPVNDLKIDTAGWEYNESGQVWYGRI
jgi:sugar/nucleoside kinase (ribokinase family)